MFADIICSSMAFLAFGITSPRSLGIATGVLVGVWGLLQLITAYMVFQRFFDTEWTGMLMTVCITETGLL